MLSWAALADDFNLVMFQADAGLRSTERLQSFFERYCKLLYRFSVLLAQAASEEQAMWEAMPVPDQMQSLSKTFNNFFAYIKKTAALQRTAVEELNAKLLTPLRAVCGEAKVHASALARRSDDALAEIRDLGSSVSAEKKALEAALDVMESVGKEKQKKKWAAARDHALLLADQYKETLRKANERSNNIKLLELPCLMHNLQIGERTRLLHTNQFMATFASMHASVVGREFELCSELSVFQDPIDATADIEGFARNCPSHPTSRARALAAAAMHPSFPPTSTFTSTSTSTTSSSGSASVSSSGSPDSRTSLLVSLSPPSSSLPSHSRSISLGEGGVTKAQAAGVKRSVVPGFPFEVSKMPDDPRAACLTSLLFHSTVPQVMAHQRTAFPTLLEFSDQAVPMLVDRLIEAVLDNGGLQMEGIFRVSASSEEVLGLRRSFESGHYEVGPCSPHLPAGLLKYWLRELGEPIIPYSLYATCMRTGIATDIQTDHSLPTPQKGGRVMEYNPIDSRHAGEVKAVLDSLSEVSREVVIRVVRVIRRVVYHQSHTKMGVQNIATVFAPSFFRGPGEEVRLDPSDLINHSNAGRAWVALLIRYMAHNDGHLVEKEEESKDSATGGLSEGARIASVSLPAPVSSTSTLLSENWLGKRCVVSACRLTSVTKQGLCPRHDTVTKGPLSMPTSRAPSASASPSLKGKPALTKANTLRTPVTQQRQGSRSRDSSPKPSSLNTGASMSHLSTSVPQRGKSPMRSGVSLAAPSSSPRHGGSPSRSFDLGEPTQSDSGLSCPSCGAPGLRNSSRFCVSCGQPIKSSVPPKSSHLAVGNDNREGISDPFGVPSSGSPLFPAAANISLVGNTFVASSGDVAVGADLDLNSSTSSSSSSSSRRGTTTQAWNGSPGQSKLSTAAVYASTVAMGMGMSPHASPAASPRGSMHNKNPQGNVPHLALSSDRTGTNTTTMVIGNVIASAGTVSSLNSGNNNSSSSNNNTGNSTATANISKLPPLTSPPTSPPSSTTTTLTITPATSPSTASARQSVVSPSPSLVSESSKSLIDTEEANEMEVGADGGGEEEDDEEQSQEKPDGRQEGIQTGKEKEEKAKDPAVMRDTRRRVVDELVQTERTYVAALSLLCSAYVTNIKLIGQDPGKYGLTDAEVADLLSNIETLANFHQAFLAQLEREVTLAEKFFDKEDTTVGAADVAGAFLRFADYFKMYTAYLNGYEKLHQVMIKHKTNKKFEAVLSDIRTALNQAGRLDLMSHLIMPVQRIPRYVLLLSELLKNTEQSHPDFPSITEALGKLKSIASHINEGKRETEAVAKLMDIQDKIKNWPAAEEKLVVPHRRFVRRGPVAFLEEGGLINKTTQVKARILFLFNDLLLWTTHDYNWRGQCRLAMMQLSTTGDELKAGELSLTSTKHHLHIRCASSDECTGWAKAIGDAVRKDKLQRQDKRSLRHKPSNASHMHDMLISKLGSLGSGSGSGGGGPAVLNVGASGGGSGAIPVVPTGSNSQRHSISGAEDAAGGGERRGGYRRGELVTRPARTSITEKTASLHKPNDSGSTDLDHAKKPVAAIQRKPPSRKGFSGPDSPK